MEREEGPQNLRGVDTQETPTRPSVDPVMDLPIRQKGKAEHVTRRWHRKTPAHHPVLLTVQKHLRVRWQIPSTERARITRGHTKEKSPKVRQAQMAHLHVQSFAHPDGPVAEHQSPAAVQKVCTRDGAIIGENHVRASHWVKVQVGVKGRGEAADGPVDGGRGRGGGGAAGDELVVAAEL